ncbi:MAG TPA: glycosyltransferase family 39 protein [Ktedonobacterales bacterium]|jgi:4-amino-4-deoxy-L-arabinose transferase-like glycosyltransferase|nr:glycosyltransferase family 39 protein [Ktedonobacterales bacterium]
MIHWFQPVSAAPHRSKAIATSPTGDAAAALITSINRLISWVLSFLWRWSAPIVIFCTAFIPRWSLAHTLDLVTDESTYIPVGRFDVALLQYGKLQNPYWHINYEAPSLPKLIIGVGSLIGSSRDTLDGFLLGARIPGVLLGALAIVLAYWLARPIFGKIPALLGALALALSPWAAYFAAIAYLDSYLLDFATVAVLLAWHAARKPWLLLLVGVLLALGFDSKYTGAFATLPVALYLAYFYFFEVRRRPPWQILLVAPILFGVIYLADPSIWVEPVGRLSESIGYQWEHAAKGHNVFLNGVVLSHVPPGEVIYILFAKMSLFVIVPAFLALPWCAYRLIQARRRPTRLDDRAAFALSWFSMLLPFGLLNIVVGTHYMLPLAPAVTFVGAWALLGAARWLGPRLAADGLTWLRRLPITRLHQRLPKLLTAKSRRYAAFALIAVASLLLTVPPAYGLATIPQAEGYTSEWLKSENATLQVAYPGYADAIDWVTDHTTGYVTVTLIANKGSLDYWRDYRQSLFPARIRMRFVTPEDRVSGRIGDQPLPNPVSKTEYVIWPAHLIQRGFSTLPNWQSHVVATIGGGGTIYCYILALPAPGKTG